MDYIITIKDITKTYKTKKRDVEVLKNIDLTFSLGKFYAIMGPSGSGKSTLFNILGLVDTPSSGAYKINGIDTTKLTDKSSSIIRMNNIGFVFQDFNLDPYLNALENVMMPLYLNKKIKKEDREKISKDILTKLNLENRLEHFPNELSGGEAQRVAIARALVNNPNIILADEPTGNLDEELETEIFKILKSLTKENKCVIVVSHSSKIKEYADVVYTLKDGKIFL
jgi:lipoprotein ABC transporter, ATP-binding protein